MIARGRHHTLDAMTPPAVAGASLAEPLLTAHDVATLLVLPPSSVYEYARRATDPLPSVSIGRHRRFLRREIEEWLERQR